ncbi:hypothetical protein BH11ACT7_BH11ACT7_05820 [soil metagenome]
MHAHKGDWLVIEGRTNEHNDERGEALIFPGAAEIDRAYARQSMLAVRRSR